MAERYLAQRMPVVGPGSADRDGDPDRQPARGRRDRLVNAVAAHDRFGGPCVVVDFGTGINFDIVSRERRVHRRR